VGVVGAGKELFEDTADRAGSVVTGAVEQAEDLLTGNVDRSDPQEMAKFRYRLEYVEGIGPAYAEKLRTIGIVTCLDLLRAGATRKGRETIVAGSGVSSNLILEWVNHVDLYRIKGVGSEYADLLEASGVDTVVELAQRNAVNLFDKLARVNLEKDLVRKLPTLVQVEDWVAHYAGL
jgi:predicted flap endonuclease-1-like 5' DNA nuclease